MAALLRGQALLAGIALILPGAVAAAVASPSPAWAHAELLASDPDDSATVSQELAELRLEFDEAVEVQALDVVDPEGNNLAHGDPHVDDTVVAQPLAEPAHTGSYTVAYRVLSADSHSVDGQLSFTYTGPTTDDAGAAAVEPDDAPGLAGWWPLAALALTALVVVVVAIVSWRGLSRRPRG